MKEEKELLKKDIRQKKKKLSARMNPRT